MFLIVSNHSQSQSFTGWKVCKQLVFLELWVWKKKIVVAKTTMKITTHLEDFED